VCTGELWGKARVADARKAQELISLLAESVVDCQNDRLGRLRGRGGGMSEGAEACVPSDKKMPTTGRSRGWRRP
jgi:hypothetical protein